MSVRPGDLIKFQGIVGLARGSCLVIAVHPIPSERWGVRLLVLTAHGRLLTRDTDLREEDNVWSRVNDDDS